jgi:Uncharacterized conserved protein (COG2071)
MEQVSHRSCPLPEKRWVLSMRWHDLLFLHWPIRPALLRPLIPSPLELDTFEDWGMDWHCTVPYDRRQAALCSLILCVSRDQRSNLRKDARPKWRLGFQLGCDELGCSQNRDCLGYRTTMPKWQSIWEKIWSVIRALVCTPAHPSSSRRRIDPSGRFIIQFRARSITGSRKGIACMVQENTGKLSMATSIIFPGRSSRRRRKCA